MEGDKIVLRGLKFHGFHGDLDEEKRLGQKFLVDMDVWMDLKPAGLSDQLSDTVNYVDLHSIAKQVMEGPSYNLIEAVAEQIASRVLSDFSQVSAVRVHVGKPHVSIPWPLDYLGVEILRRRSKNSSETEG